MILFLDRFSSKGAMIWLKYEEMFTMMICDPPHQCFKTIGRCRTIFFTSAQIIPETDRIQLFSLWLQLCKARRLASLDLLSVILNRNKIIFLDRQEIDLIPVVSHNKRFFQ
jgi:hypothetical protein